MEKTSTSSANNLELNPFDALLNKVIEHERTQLLRWEGKERRLTYSPVLAEKTRHWWQEALDISQIPPESLFEIAVSIFKRVIEASGDESLYAKKLIPRPIPHQALPYPGSYETWSDNWRNKRMFLGPCREEEKKLPIVIDLKQETHQTLHEISAKTDQGAYPMTPTKVVETTIRLVHFILIHLRDGWEFSTKRSDDPADVSFYRARFPELEAVAKNVTKPQPSVDENNTLVVSDPNFVTNGMALLREELLRKVHILFDNFLRTEADFIENPKSKL